MTTRSHLVICERNWLDYLLYGLVFFYFLTLSADLLNIQVYLYRAKLNHVLALALLPIVFLTRRKLVFAKEIFYVFLAILVSMAISCSCSPLLSRSFGYLFIYGFNFIFFFLLPFNLIMNLDERKVFKLYVWSFIAVGFYAFLQLFFSLFGFIDPLLRQFIGKFARPHAAAFEPSYYALYMSACTMFFNARFLISPVLAKKAGYYFKLLMLNLFLFISTSTGGVFSYFILFFAVCGLMLFHFRKEENRFIRIKLLYFILLVAVLLALVALVSPSLISRYYFKFFYSGFAHECFAERWRGIERCWDVFLQHPLFGVGVGGIGPYYYQTYLGDIQDFRLSLSDAEKFDPTNVFSEILASLGIVGFSAYMGLIWIFWRKFRKTVSHPQISKEERMFCHALFLSLIVVIIELQFNQGLFRSYIWTHSAITYAYLCKIGQKNMQRLQGE